MSAQTSTGLAITATLHCLTGCAIGEVLGAVIGAGLNWHNFATAGLGIILAFTFGYLLTMRSLSRHGMRPKPAFRVALASDSVSIATMEIVDTAIILLVPGALAAGPGTLLFWTSLIVSLMVAFSAAVPVNRYLINRGKGHALIHEHHK